MKAITYDKQKQRTEIEVDSITDSFTKIVSDMKVAYSITYKLSFYDKKMRPVYIEESRKQVPIEEAN